MRILIKSKRSFWIFSLRLMGRGNYHPPSCLASRCRSVRHQLLVLYIKKIQSIGRSEGIYLRCYTAAEACIVAEAVAHTLEKPCPVQVQQDD